MPPSIAVILPAAGRSARFGGSRNKLLEMLAGRTVLARSAAAFLARPDVKQLIVPTMDRAAIEAGLEPEQRADERLRFCLGGESRAHSVRNGLDAVDGAIEWVAVHDAARPLVSQELIGRTLAAAMEHGAAVPALPVELTIKQAQGPLPARVERTVPRQSLWAMQTPQIMRRQALLEAFRTCPIPLAGVTDDVQLIELAGGEVWLVAGEARNLKITMAMDLRVGEMAVSGQQVKA